MDGIAENVEYAGYAHHEAEKHTITIQRHYRGYKGRREYSTALWGNGGGRAREARKTK